jgi:hypothetical protein
VKRQTEEKTMYNDKHCMACTFGYEGEEFCARHRTARELRLALFLAEGVIALPSRRYRLDVAYQEGWGEEFVPWTDTDVNTHEPRITHITMGTTYVQFDGETHAFRLYGDSEGASADPLSAEHSARCALDWTFERRDDILFSLASNWLQPVEIPMRDDDVWGLELRGYGPWGKSSVGRTRYAVVHTANFLERDLMDIVGVAGREEWDAGLGVLAPDANRWQTSIVIDQAGTTLAPIKHPGKPV